MACIWIVNVVTTRTQLDYFILLLVSIILNIVNKYDSRLIHTKHLNITGKKNDLENYNQNMQYQIKKNNKKTSVNNTNE